MTFRELLEKTNTNTFVRINESVYDVLHLLYDGTDEFLDSQVGEITLVTMLDITKQE